VYTEELPEPPKLDVLFISHLHRDHVNGVDNLLGKVRVEMVVLPYLSKTERLALLAASLEEGPPPSASFVQLLSNPPRWFADRGVNKVVLVKRGKGPPKMGESLEPRAPLQTEDMRLELKKSSPPKEQPPDIQTLDGRSVGVVSVLDTDPMRVMTSVGELNWMFLTFVHPEDAKFRRFLMCIKKSFGDMPAEEKWLVGVVQDSEMRRRLRSCYNRIRNDLNLTSLSLYSGPVTLTPHFRTKVWCQPGQPWVRGCTNACRLPQNDRCAWLGTGDSNLFRERRRSEFMRHFKPVSNYIYSLALPHHGSKRNYDPQLLDLGPRVCIVSAGTHYRYGHPDPEVVHSVLDAERVLVRVDQDLNSVWHEEVSLSVA
jgi:hypothetical protein